nr:hypothetical protein [Tanacetum cinerariifolium]
QDDDDQDDNDDDQDTDNDGDDFVHPKLSIHKEEDKYEESFDPIIQTPKNSNDEGKGFFGVETPLFEGMLVAQEVGSGVADEVHDEGVYATALTRRVEHSELDKIAQALDITQLKRRVKKLERRNKEVEELKRHLQIVPNEDGDVYIEATPLTHKVPVVSDIANGDQDAKVDESVDIQGRQAES